MAPAWRPAQRGPLHRPNVRLVPTRLGPGWDPLHRAPDPGSLAARPGWSVAGAWLEPAAADDAKRDSGPRGGGATRLRDYAAPSAGEVL